MTQIDWGFSIFLSLVVACALVWVGIRGQENLTLQQCKDYGKARLGDVIIKCEIVQGGEVELVK